MAQMIRESFTLAFGHLRDPRFRRIALIGAALSVALLFAIYALLIQLFTNLGEGVFTFSDGTRMDRLGSFFSVISVATMLMLGSFLMIPVASLFTGLHLNVVADDIENWQFPDLPPAQPLPAGKLWIDSVNHFGLIFFINLISLISFTIFGLVWGILLFWVLNGWLLAREYANMIPERRPDPAATRAFRMQHRRALVLAGIVLAVLLSVPFTNLLMPVIGVAAFTHLIHRLPYIQPQGTPT